MKTKLTLFTFLLLLSMTVLAQPKPIKAEDASAKTLNALLKGVHQTTKVTKSSNKTCDPLPIINGIPKADLIGSNKELATGIKKLMDSLSFKKGVDLKKPYGDLYRAFIKAKNLSGFIKKVFNVDFGDLEKKERKDVAAFYQQLKNLKKQEIIIYKKAFKNTPCSYKVETKLKLTDWNYQGIQNEFVNQPFRYRMDFSFTTKLTLDCSCTGNDNTKLKSAVVFYKGNIMANLNPLSRQLDFQTVRKPKYKASVTQYSCCSSSSSENGSFMDPDQNEPISFPNQFLEVGAGIGTAKDEETELCATVGFMHNLFSEEENNALFIGARAKVNNASFSGSDFSQTTVNVGPVVEHQSFIGDTSTKWINGINGAFVFGSQDNAGFQTDISGFNIGLYTGVEVALGNQIALGVMATLVEYNNQTFKTDEGEFKTNSTGLNLNKGSVGLSLRIDLDSNQ